MIRRVKNVPDTSVYEINPKTFCLKYVRVGYYSYQILLKIKADVFCCCVEMFTTVNSVSG